MPTLPCGVGCGLGWQQDAPAVPYLAAVSSRNTQIEIRCESIAKTHGLLVSCYFECGEHDVTLEASSRGREVTR